MSAPAELSNDAYDEIVKVLIAEAEQVAVGARTP